MRSVCTLLQSVTVNYLTYITTQNYICESMRVIKSVRNVYAREVRDIYKCNQVSFIIQNKTLLNG